MVISNVISRCISNALYNNGRIEPEYVESYQYCLDLTFDFILFHGSLLFLGMLMGQLFPTCIYIITLTPLKLMAGGAHAKTPLLCSIISYSVYFCTIFISSQFMVPEITAIILILLIALAIWIQAPVEHPNKRFDLPKRKKIRRALLIYLCLSTIITMVLFFSQQEQSLLVILICYCTTFLNQMIGRILYREGQMK